MLGKEKKEGMKRDNSAEINLRPAGYEEQELTLAQISSILLAHKKVVFGLPILVGAAALVGVLLLKNQWEATGIIQVGHVGGEALVEPVQRATERLTVGSFDRSVLGGLGISTDGPTAKLYRDSKRVKHLHTDLIEIRVRAHTPDEAVNLAEATAMALGRIHESVAEPSIAHLRQRLEQSRKDLDQAEALKVKVQKALNSQRSIGATDRLVLLTNMQQLNIQSRDLQGLVANLEEQLRPHQTYPTSLFGAVEVSEGPVSPKRTLIVVVAVLIGSLLGVVAALMWDAARRERHINADVA